jgi:predicted alpha-1,6-mannanase (GH76 family)
MFIAGSMRQLFKNKRMKIKIELLFILFVLSVQLCAQQVIADYSLMDETTEISSSATDNHTIALLCDRNENTFFEITAFVPNSWIQFKLKNPAIAKGYSIVSSNNELCDPKNFKLEGSVDGTTWTRFGTTVYGLTFPGRYQSAVVSLNTNLKAYSYYRLTILTINGGASLKMSEFQLFGYPELFENDLSKSTTTVLTGEYAGNGSNPLSNIIDNDVTHTFKQNDTKNCWIQYEFESPSKIAGYALQTANELASASNPRSWELLASADGQNWDVLDARSNKNMFGVTNNMQVYRIANESKKYDWGAYADSAQQSMIKLFWNSYGSGKYLTHSYHTNPDSINRGFNYWWMAHVIDVFSDGLARTGNIEYKTKMNSVYNAMKSYGNNSLRNSFYDDMEWMGLACLRANEVYPSSPKWKESAVELWNWIKHGWNETNAGGGIQWEASRPTSKNACSNAPAIILAARLYTETGDQAYLDWAIRIFNWMNSNLIFPENGLVKDSYGNNELSWTLTYNQGTWLGACLELYKITNDLKYFNIAMKTADYVVDDYLKFSPHGILYNNEGGGDGGLFKGIFMRYLSQWILSGKLDQKRQNKFITYFIENGKSVWESSFLRPMCRFGNTWYQRPNGILTTDKKTSGYDASIHLSATMLFELLDELDRKGFLPQGNLQPEAVESKEKEYKYIRLNINSINSGNNLELSRWQVFSDFANGINDKIDIKVPVCVYTKDGAVTIQSNEMFAYSIYDLKGQLLKARVNVNGYCSEKLPKAVYVVQVRMNNFTYSQKIILK